MLDWMGNMILFELYKKLKFDLTIKWYVNKQENVLINETHEVMWVSYI